MKQLKLQVFPPDESDTGSMEIGKANIQKMPDGTVRVDATITNLKVAEQLGGNKISGVITNYEGDPEEL